ncbi:hypothetical protein CKO28_18845 [Rhodovibrio sodomensis]|uniref:Uncharacterized protein n=1 Tax=Rhodovibrio sodomensis TaxID=1088 RepID=A0ABS1DJ19_9PROT|nr:hypothetical protein [Rhodovibrio sodomensis]MBK1670097.1 hypothetical protein [Rhodovibrio sodomensis]
MLNENPALGKVPYSVALEAAKAAKAEADRTLGGERGHGCGRVYVNLPHTRANAKNLKAVEAAGFKVLRGPGTPSIYIGYDNNSGRELAVGAAVARTLKDYGVSAYRDEHAD